MTNGIKIINLEGSEILKEMDGRQIKKEYKTVLPYSLVTEKLNRLHVQVKDNKSKDFIGVNFSYGYDTKEIKEIKNKIHIEKERIKDLNKKTTLAKKDGDVEEEEVLLEQLQIEYDILEELENDYKSKKSEWNKDGIREKLYKEGFTLTHIQMQKYKEIDEKGKEITKIRPIKEEKINYKFWFRTPAKSRVGDSLFVNEEIYDEITKWQDMGLTLPKGETKVVEFQAYRSLTSSNIESVKEINTKNILIVNDLESYMDTDIVSVELNKDGECVAVSRKDKVKNTLWDGMALLDSSYFKEGHNFYLLRNHFFKSCAFNTNVVQFFQDWCIANGKDYETYQAQDRYGNNIRVKNIRLIATENSMKFEKFAECDCIGKDGKEITSKKQMYSYWKKIVKDDRNMFGICKHNHSSKFGDMQRMSYQMVNTLLTDKKQTEELAQHTVDYINNLKDNNEAFLQMLQETATEGNNNNMYIDLYNQNIDFKESDMYKSFKTQTISSMKNRARQGKLLVEGDNLTVCGNPYMLLLHAVGEVPNTNNIVENGFTDITLPVSDKFISCYTERFNDGEDLSGFRNPHNASNNIALFSNIKHNLMQKYFNFGKNVIAVNLVKTELQDLANGLDEDSDFLLVTNDKITTSATKEVFRKKDYSCIVNNIPKSNKTWINDNSSVAEIDNILSKSKNSIGITSNLAQLALSYYQHENTNELRNIACIASVLAQVSIDNAKKTYDIDIEKEIDRIQKMECIKKYNGMLPNWFKYIKKDVKANRLLKEDNCKCTMQHLQLAIDTIKNIKSNKENLNTLELLKDIKMNGDTNYTQIKIIKGLVEKYDKKVKKTKELAKKYKWKEDKIEEEVRDTRDNVMGRIGSMKLTEETMYYLVKDSITPVETKVEETKVEETETKEEKISSDKKCKIKMLNVLYSNHKELFLSVWK